MFNDAIHSDIKRFGIDSPLYPLLKQLEKEVDSRLPGETLTKWLKRILPIEKTKRYFDVIELHNRYRFNPGSDKQQEKRSLMGAINRLTEQKT